MGRKWSVNAGSRGGRGGPGSKKRNRQDASDDEEEEHVRKKTGSGGPQKKSQGEGSFLTHGLQLAQKTLNIPVEDLSSAPAFRRDFWDGPRCDENTLEENKSIRKTLGILLRGPDVEKCPLPISSISDAGLPTSFASVFSKARLVSPTLVQRQAWPAILSGNNVLCIAPTGSGKTLAYGLPLIPHVAAEKIARKGSKSLPVRPIGLILVPTRELAIQVALALRPLKAVASIQVVPVYGGQDKDAQLEQLSGGAGTDAADIIVATPGRLIDLMSSKHVSTSRVTYLVLDEADRMLALGFEEQLNTLAAHIRNDKQALLFSATFPGRLRNSCANWIGEALTLRVNTMELSNDYLRDRVQSVAVSNPEVPLAEGSSSSLRAAKEALGEQDTVVEEAVTEASDLADQYQLSSSLTISRTVTQEVHVCVPHKKPRLLLRYILRTREKEKADGTRQPGPMLIFCGKIKTINYLLKFLNGQGLVVDKFHGQMAQPAREKVLNDFKAGKINIMCATDVAARGIHIKRLKYVVNYDFPNNLEQYCHRIGRAGRQGEIGYSYSFLTRNAALIAKDLIVLLKSCGQTIEPNLLQLEKDYENGLIVSSSLEESEELVEGEGEDVSTGV